MPRLLRDWAADGTTGTLTVTAEPPADQVCTVLVQDGSIVFATRRSRRDPTGELFLELFQIPSYGFDDDEEVDLVRSQITRVVTDLFNWQDVESSFQPEITLTRWPSLRLPLSDLMRCGMLAVVDTGRVREWLGDGPVRYARTDDPYGLFLLPMDEHEEAVVAKLDEPRTIEELVESTGVTEELVVRLVAAFVFGGALEATEVAEGAAPDEPSVERDAGAFTWIETSATEPGSGSDAVLMPEPGSVPEMDPSFDPHETAKFWYEVEEKARAIRDDRDFYSLLEVDRRADTDAICARYRLLATDFHPDKSSRFAPRDEDGRTQLDVIFDALTTAFVVLTKPAFRAVYDQELLRRERELALPVTTTKPLVIPPSAPLPPAAEFVTKPLAPIAASAEPEPRPAEPPAPPRGPSPSAATSGASMSAADWYVRGEQFEAAGDHARAAQAYERCAELGPERSKVYLALGRTLARVSDGADRAEEALLKAIAISPFSTACYVALGELFARLGRHEEAKEQLRRALSINSTDAEATAALAALERPGPSLIRRFFGNGA